MKVLHVIHSLDPRSGGPSHALRGLVRAQVAAGHQVAVLATDVQSAEPWADRDDYARRIRDDVDLAGAEVVLGRAYGRHRPWSRFSYTPAGGRWLRARLSDPRAAPNVIHIHGVFSHLTTLAATLARRFRVPYVVRPAGSFDPICLQMGSARWKRAFCALLVRRDLRQAAAVQATSPAEAVALGPWADPAKIRVVPHGVAVPDSDTASAQAELLGRFPQLRGRRVILFLSRVAAKKRPDLLAKAVHLAQCENEPLALLIAGQDAGHLPQLQYTVHRLGMDNDVAYCGFLEGEAKAAAFGLAEMLVLPSLNENFGVAVVEALAHGVPAVVTSGVAAHVYVDESGCGLTVDDSPQALADGICRVLAADRAQMGAKGRAYAIDHLSWPAVARLMDELYDEIVGGFVGRVEPRPSPAHETTRVPAGFAKHVDQL